MSAYRHWKFTLFIFFFVVVCASLGIWQLSRAKQKRALLQKYAVSIQHAPLHANDLSSIKEMRFFQARLEGFFINEKTLLLDNKIFNGRLGYEVYTPFKAKGLAKLILVDRGFLPMMPTRAQLPAVPPIYGLTSIIGLLNTPPSYVTFSKRQERLTHPLRVEFIDLSQLMPFTGELYPYIILLHPQDPHALPIEWRIVTMGPERHLGYAVQWFALAITLLLLFAFTNRGKPQPSND